MAGKQSIHVISSYSSNNVYNYTSLYKKLLKVPANDAIDAVGRSWIT